MPEIKLHRINWIYSKVITGRSTDMIIEARKSGARIERAMRDA